MLDTTTELYARIDLAQRQIATLEADIDRYLNDSVEIIFSTNPIDSIRKFLAHAKINNFIPLEIRVSSGLILNELRVLLDNLATSRAKLVGNSNLKDVYFPICASKQIFEQHGKRHIRKLSGADRDLITSLNPYLGGNDALYYLHDLDKSRKHYELCVQAACLNGMIFTDAFGVTTEIGGPGANIFSYEIRHGPEWTKFQSPALSSLFQEILSSTLPIARVDGISPVLSFPAAGRFERMSIPAALRVFADEVSSVVSKFDDH